MAIADTVKKIAVGDVAHDAADAGAPLKFGGYAKATAPTAVADGDRVNAWFDPNGRLVVNLASLTAPGQAAMAASLPVVIASNQTALPIAQEVWSASIAALRKRLAVYAGALSGAMLWPAPMALRARLLDLVFSTDTACALTLHQSTTATYAAQIVADGAAHLWKLAETSGNAADSIGALTLTAAGSLTYSQASSVCADGKAILFDGATGKFTSATKPASCATGAIEAWVYLPAALGTDGAYLSASDTATANEHMQLYIQTTGKPGLMLRTASTVRFVASAEIVLPIKTWHHVVWQHDGTGLECFVDGVSIPITYTTGNSSTAYWWDDLEAVADNFIIGVLTRTSNALWWPGRLQLVAWYAAHKAANVWLNHYRLGAPLFGPHYFAANGGVAQQLKTPLDAEISAAIYASTNASVSATIEVLGYEF